MSSEAIASVAHDVVAINRTTALKAVEAQCKGVLRLIDAPLNAFAKSRKTLSVGTPLCQIADNLNDLSPKVRRQSEALLENYGRVAAKVIDWVTDRADSGISKVDETLLSRSGTVVGRALMPGMELMRRVAEQTSSLTERAADFVAADAGPSVVTEHAAGKTKMHTRKTSKTTHHA